MTVHCMNRLPGSPDLLDRQFYTGITHGISWPEHHGLLALEDEESYSLHLGRISMVPAHLQNKRLKGSTQEEG